MQPAREDSPEIGSSPSPASQIEAPQPLCYICWFPRAAEPGALELDDHGFTTRREE